MAITLEEVQNAFKLWRGERLKKGPIPDHLWSMVVALLPNYGRSKIMLALKMSSTQLDEGCAKYQRRHQSMQNGFAVGYFDQDLPFFKGENNKPKRCKLTLKGAHKSLRISIEISQLAQALPVIVGYL